MLRRLSSRFHSLRAFALGAALIVSIPAIYSQITGEPKQKGLPMLPPGSTLTKLRIPGYDESRRLQSILDVAKLDIIDADHFLAHSIRLRFYSPEGVQTSQIDLETASIDRTTNLLRSDQPVHIKDISGELHAAGLIINIKTKETFFIGPCRSTFNLETLENRTAMNLRHQTISLISAASLASPAIAKVPGDASPETLAKVKELSELSKPVGKDSQVSEELKKRDASVDQSLAAFTAASGIKTIADTSAPKNKAAEKPQSTFKTHRVTASNEGGMYSIPEKLAFVLLKDIKLVDELKKVSFDCKKEVKIFFTEKAPKKGAKKSSHFFQKIGELSSVIAKGEVTIIQTFEDGSTMTAKAETAYYDALTEELILQDGSPSVIHPNGSFIAKRPNQRIVVNLKTGDISFTGGFDLEAEPKEIKNTLKAEKKARDEEKAKAADSTN